MPKKVRTKKNRGSSQHRSGLKVRDADLKRARPFKWAWDQRILLGYLNLQIGEEGIGKGNFTAWVAARITRGQLSGSLSGRPSRVAFVGDEDAWDHIWVPRLHAAGVNLDFVEYIESGPDGAVLNLKTDANALQDYVVDREIVLVYIDQLLDNLGYTDSWKDKEVRDTLAPLRSIAQKADCAILASMHPNKRQGTFRDRISGTPAFNALSRSSLLIAGHPDESGRVFVVRAKGNYSVEPAAFEFRIEEHRIDVAGRTIVTSRITDQRESQLKRDDLLDQKSGGNSSQAAQARSRLAELFADDTVKPAAEVLGLMEAEGFPGRVIQQARKDVGLETWAEGFQGPHQWGRKRPDPRPKGKKQ